MIIVLRDETDLRDFKHQHQRLWHSLLCVFYEFTRALHFHHGQYAIVPEQTRSQWYACVVCKRYYGLRQKEYRLVVNRHISSRVLFIPPPTPAQLVTLQRIRDGWPAYYAFGRFSNV